MKEILPFLIVISILLFPKISSSQNNYQLEIESSVYDKLKLEGKINPLINYKIKSTALPSTLQNTISTNNQVLSGTCQSTVNLPYSPIAELLNVDDGSTQINLPFNFCFYGSSYNSCFVNSNGTISFGAAMNAFSSTGFPINPDKVIAPFWADFDNRGGNGIVKMSMAADYIIITWDSVGYYSMQGGKRNTCSVILTNGSSAIISSGNNVGFIYENMDWTTGDASSGTNGLGGTPATIGVNKGDGTTFFQIGRFSNAGSNYYGNTATNNGIDWLDNKSFFFNTCSSNNTAPISTNYSSCDTVKMCNFADVLLLENFFASPEVNQNTTVTVSAPSLGSNISTYLNTSGSSAHVINQINANPSLLGYHTITYTASDNGSPAQITTINLTLRITTGTTVAPQLTMNPSAVCPRDSIEVVLTNCSNFTQHTWSNNSNGCSTYFNSNNSEFIVVKDFNGCTQTEPININLNIQPEPTPIVIGNSIICEQQGPTILQLAPKDSGEPNYSQIVWNPGNVIGNSFSATAGNYTVSVTGNNGCVNDTTFEITNYNMPEILTSNYCLTSIPKDSLQLLPDFSCASGLNCNIINSNSCPITGTAIQIGNQSSNSNPSPTPFLGYWEDAKSQFLYKATELQSQGINEGLISSLAFNIPTILSNSPYNNFTIKLKCTSTDQLLIGTFESGAITVYANNSFTPISGWNTFVFSMPYLYDGVSNLLIEICFDNNSWSATDNVEYTDTNYPASSAMDLDGDIGCSLSNSERNTYSHPNVKFNFASNVNTSNYTINWTPSTGLSSTNIINPYLLPNLGNSTYTLTISNIGNTCINEHMFTFNVDENNPQIVAQPVGDSLCLQQNYSFNTLVSGTISNYQWRKDGVALVDNSNLNGSNTNTLTITNTAIGDEGWYTCYITGNCTDNLVTDSVYLKINNCIGLNKFANSSQLLIYPNPASAELTVNLNRNVNQIKEIEIYNVLGEKVKFTASINNNVAKININDLANGFYTLSIIGIDQRFVGSFIKE